MHRFEPTYKRIGDHTEAILIEFNEELTYQDILEKFWRSCACTLDASTGPPSSTTTKGRRSPRRRCRPSLLVKARSGAAIRPGTRDALLAGRVPSKYLAKMLSMNSMLYGEERKPIPAVSCRARASDDGMTAALSLRAESAVRRATH